MKPTNYRKVFSILFLCFCYFSIKAQQQKQIVGKVVDENNQPLAGASVSIKEANTATLTNIDGNFTLEIPDSVTTLIVSYLGMNAQDIDITNKNSVTVKMSSSNNLLNEVVVIGYGTQRKGDINSSISTVTAKEIENIPQVSIDQLLQGKVPGLYVSQNSGAPGSNTSVQIRGITSLSAANDPLYVIDGVAFSGDPNNFATSGRSAVLNNKGEIGAGNGESTVSPLASINPNDIESVNVLKDAAATAIYGSRGSNGVIIITTKRGKAGQGSIKYDGYYAIREQGKFLDVMNLREYADFQNRLADMIGVQRRSEFVNPEFLSEGTNWQDEVFRVADQQSHQISLSGAKDGTDYYISGNYTDQAGTIVGSDYNRYSFRTNINGQVRKWFKAGVVVGASRSFENRGISDNGGIVTNALLSAPDRPVRNADGSFAGPQIFESGSVINPIAQALDVTNTLLRSNLNGSIYTDITFFKGLTLRSEINGDFNSSEARQFLPTYDYGPLNINATAKLTEYYADNTFWTWKEYLTYKNVFAQKHDLTALLGYEVNQSTWKGIDASRQSFFSNDLQSLNLGDAKTATNNEYKDGQALQSYFARSIYTYSGKYSLSATIRSDRSSKFAPGNQTGIFPSAGASWRISEEPFAAGIKDAVSNLRLRASYGGTGNQAVPNYLYGVALTALPTGLGTGFAVDKIKNLDLRWETAIQADIGLDFSLLNGRIDGTIEYYHKTSKDFLFRAQLPAYLLGQSAEYSAAGVITPPFINGGKLENKGVEFSLTSQNLVGDFKWNSSVNFSSNKNKVLSLADGTPFISGAINVSFLSLPVSRTRVGGPVGEFYGYKVKDLFRTEEQLRNAPIQFDRPVRNGTGTWFGDLQFEDLNGDNVINNDDQTYLGSPQPKFTYGITNNFSYKNFDLTFFLSGSYGAKIFNALTYRIATAGDLYLNQLASVADYWTPENSDSNIPAPKRGDNPNQRPSDRFIESGSYLRIQNVNFGYTIPRKIADRIKLSNAKIYVSGQNLHVFTPYSGLDPELGAISQNVFLSNVDLGRYPGPRIITFGINAQF